MTIANDALDFIVQGPTWPQSQPLVLRIGGYLSTYGWHAGCTHPIGMLSVLIFVCLPHRTSHTL